MVERIQSVLLRLYSGIFPLHGLFQSSLRTVSFAPRTINPRSVVAGPSGNIWPSFLWVRISMAGVSTQAKSFVSIHLFACHSMALVHIHITGIAMYCTAARGQNMFFSCLSVAPTIRLSRSIYDTSVSCPERDCTSEEDDLGNANKGHHRHSP